ncbi:hypothetical protein [Pseudomonas sp. EMN2]|uniref:hypothetical protein n=1 Tax=Pseudomonas sp. EMN2 TaxID=2615212 RepID=UPI00129A4CC4|nr:hypothetical protein [Pseudomonas sp. EMN2]
MDSTREEYSSAIAGLKSALAQVKHFALEANAISTAVFFSPVGQALEGCPVELFLSAISTWEVEVDSEHGTVPRYPGLVSASPALIKSIEALNDAKQRFAAAGAGLSASSAKERREIARLALRQSGLSRAHPLQCARTVSIVRQTSLRSIGFTETRKSISSVTMPVSEAIAKLTRADAWDLIEEVERKVAERGCKQVRWVKAVAPFLRANISFQQEDALGKMTLHASLPIVVPHGAWPKKVKFNLPKAESVGRTRRVADEDVIRIGENAYLDCC